jgi:hypothetical protein
VSTVSIRENSGVAWVSMVSIRESGAAAVSIRKNGSVTWAQTWQ